MALHLQKALKDGIWSKDGLQAPTRNRTNLRPASFQLVPGLSIRVERVTFAHASYKHLGWWGDWTSYWHTCGVGMCLLSTPAHSTFICYILLYASSLEWWGCCTQCTLGWLCFEACRVRRAHHINFDNPLFVRKWSSRLPMCHPLAGRWASRRRNIIYIHTPTFNCAMPALLLPPGRVLAFWFSSSTFGVSPSTWNRWHTWTYSPGVCHQVVFPSCPNPGFGSVMKISIPRDPQTETKRTYDWSILAHTSHTSIVSLLAFSEGMWIHRASVLWIWFINRWDQKNQRRNPTSALSAWSCCFLVHLQEVSISRHTETAKLRNAADPDLQIW